MIVDPEDEDRLGRVIDLAAKRREDNLALDFVDPRRWTGPAPKRKWIVPEWIPRGYVTALYGDGGIGKSRLAQQLLTSVACALPWLGMDVHGGRAVGLMCEDDVDELHRRQEAINAAYQLRPENLENLRYWPRLGFDNLLMTFNGGAEAQGMRTELFERLVKRLDEFRPMLIGLDTVADVFGGDEIRRGQVRQFVQNCCGYLARRYDCSVLLLAHPSASGLSSGSGTGGSTAWSNTVRSRLYLTSPKDDSDLRTLSRKKANYAAKGDLSLRWQDGVFTREADPKPKQKDDPLPWDVIAALFDEIDRAWKAGEPWSNEPQTRSKGRYLPLWAFTHHGVKEHQVRRHVDLWLAGGYLKAEVFDSRYKSCGLRMIRHMPDHRPSRPQE